MAGKSPYHAPIVRIFWVAIREGHNYPLFLTWAALSFLSVDLDSVFELPVVFRGRCEGTMSGIAICEQSVSIVSKSGRLSHLELCCQVDPKSAPNPSPRNLCLKRLRYHD